MLFYYVWEVKYYTSDMEEQKHHGKETEKEGTFQQTNSVIRTLRLLEVLRESTDEIALLSTEQQDLFFERVMETSVDIDTVVLAEEVINETEKNQK